MATPNQVLMVLPYLTSHLTLADIRSSHLISSHQGARLESIGSVPVGSLGPSIGSIQF